MQQFYSETSFRDWVVRCRRCDFWNTAFQGKKSIKWTAWQSGEQSARCHWRGERRVEGKEMRWDQDLMDEGVSRAVCKDEHGQFMSEGQECHWKGFYEEWGAQQGLSATEWCSHAFVHAGGTLWRCKWDGLAQWHTAGRQPPPRAEPAAAAGSAGGWLLASEQTEGLTLLAPLAGSLQQPVSTSALALPPHPWRAVSADPSFSSSAAACPLHGGVEDGVPIGFSPCCLQQGVECGVVKSLTSTSVSTAANEVGFLQICVSCSTDLGIKEGVSSDLSFSCNWSISKGFLSCEFFGALIKCDLTLKPFSQSGNLSAFSPLHSCLFSWTFYSTFETSTPPSDLHQIGQQVQKFWGRSLDAQGVIAEVSFLEESRIKWFTILEFNLM